MKLSNKLIQILLLVAALVFWALVIRDLYLIIFGLSPLTQGGFKIQAESFSYSELPIRPLWFQVHFIGFLATTTFFIRQLFLWIERLDVITMLWRLFMIGMGGVSSMLLVLVLYKNLIENVTGLVSRGMQSLFYAIAMLAVLVFFLSAIFIFKRFILYQKNRRKLLSWRVFTGFLFAGWVLSIKFLFADTAKAQIWESTIYVYAFFFVLMLLYLASHTSWIAYLDFNQKLRALGLFILILIVSSTFLFAMVQLPKMLDFGELVNDVLEIFYISKTFFIGIISFTALYSLASVLVLFFNLPTSSVFELKSAELVLFNRINQTIRGNLDFSDILQTLLDASMLSADAQAGWIEVFDEKENKTIDHLSGIGDKRANVLSSRFDFKTEAEEERTWIMFKNLKRHRAYRDLDPKFRSLLCLPIFSEDKLYGLLFIAKEVSAAFEDINLSSLYSFSEQAGSSIENAKKVHKAIDLEIYHEQLKIAQEMQKELLPNTLPESDKVEFAVVTETAEEVGGDYFDIIPDGEKGFHVAVGDVSGKGTTAAFYMAEVKGIFHALSRAGVPPLEFIRVANEAVSACFQKGFFVTLSYLYIDTQKREIQLVRAGHCPAFYYTKKEDKVSLLREGTLGLGIVRSDKFSNHLDCCEPQAYASGDILVLYTDGIIEARNSENEEYGYDRMQAVIEAHTQSSPENIGAKMIEDAKDFAGENIRDDYSLLVIRFS